MYTFYYLIKPSVLYVARVLNRSKVLQSVGLLWTNFDVQFYYVNKPVRDFRWCIPKCLSNKITEVRILFFCIGLRPIVLFVLCTLSFESTKYEKCKFHPDNMHPKSPKYCVARMCMRFCLNSVASHCDTSPPNVYPTGAMDFIYPVTCLNCPINF